MSSQERLIIENRTDLPMTAVLQLCGRVVRRGRVSNYGQTLGDGYCFCTMLGVREDELAPERKVLVSAFKNKCSDRLVVCYYGEPEHAR